MIPVIICLYIKVPADGISINQSDGKGEPPHFYFITVTLFY